MEYTWDLIKVLLVLLVVLFLFYMIAKFFKEKKFFNQTDQIRVLERNYLDSQHTIYLLEVVEEIWLVTTTKDEIEFVKKLDLDSKELEKPSIQKTSILNYFKKGTDGSNEE